MHAQLQHVYMVSKYRKMSGNVTIDVKQEYYIDGSILHRIVFATNSVVVQDVAIFL